MKLESMYQEVILDHYKHPQHSGLRDPHDCEVHHVNPSCGDELTLRVLLSEDGKTVEDVIHDSLAEDRLSATQQSMLHNWILDVSSPKVKTLFSKGLPPRECVLVTAVDKRAVDVEQDAADHDRSIAVVPCRDPKPELPMVVQPDPITLSRYPFARYAKRTGGLRAIRTGTRTQRSAGVWCTAARRVSLTIGPVPGCIRHIRFTPSERSAHDITAPPALRCRLTHCSIILRRHR